MATAVKAAHHEELFLLGFMRIMVACGHRLRQSRSGGERRRKAIMDATVLENRRLRGAEESCEFSVLHHKCPVFETIRDAMGEYGYNIDEQHVNTCAI
jgi:hypothetical protein